MWTPTLEKEWRVEIPILLHPRKFCISSSKNKRLKLYILKQMNISLVGCAWIKSMTVDSSLFSKLHKWTTFHVRVKKIPCDKEDTKKKAPVCLEELISLCHGSPFHILLFSRVTLFPTQIVMWGNWVCGKQPPLTGAQMGFLVFRLSPHNHYYVYFHISSSTPIQYTFWFLTDVDIHLFSPHNQCPNPDKQYYVN